MSSSQHNGRMITLFTFLILIACSVGLVQAATSSPTAASRDELKAALLEAFDQRWTTFTVNYTGDVPNREFLSALIKEIFDADDYLKYTISTSGYSYQGADGATTVTFTFTYLENKEQVDYVTTQVQAILATILTDGINDHQKVKAIHDYVLLHVAYDQTLQDHSAYGALTKGKTVCQGYALLTYQMLQQAGLEARIVSGKGNGQDHAWNVVKIEGHWYQLDTTWDDPVPDQQGRITYGYYNLSDGQLKLKKHQWTAGQYPVADTDYFAMLQAKRQTDPANRSFYDNLISLLTRDQAVSSRTLSKLAAGSPTLGLKPGVSSGIALIATYSDGSTANVASAATWISSKPTLATVNSQGGVTASDENYGTAVISGTYQGRTVRVTVNNGLKSLVADLKNVGLLPGAAKHIKLIATYADGTTADVTSLASWESSKQEVATVNAGTIQAATSNYGSTTIKATYAGKTISIPVSNALKSLVVSPKNVAVQPGWHQQLTVIATFADGSMENVTTQVVWAVAKSELASIVDGDVTLSIAQYGSTTIKGSYAGKSVSVPVTNVPRALVADTKAVSIKPGAVKQIRLIATQADGTKEDVTAWAEWSSAKPEIATVNAGEITLSATVYGSTTVKATYNGKTISIPVSNALRALKADVKSVATRPGIAQQTHLQATYADGSTADVTASATWESSKVAVASVSKGLVTLSTATFGSASIRASFGGKTVTISVANTPKSLSADTHSLTMRSGETKQVTVLVTYADGMTADVTSSAFWKSSKASALNVNRGSIATGSVPGRYTVSASYGGKNVSVAVTVTS